MDYIGTSNGSSFHGTRNGSSFQKLLNYSTQKKKNLLDYSTQKKKKLLDYVRKQRQKLLVDDDDDDDDDDNVSKDALPPRRPRRFNDKPVLPPPPKEQTSTDVPQEPLQHDFSKWVNDMDAAADMVDIVREEAYWNQQSTDQANFPRRDNLQMDAYTPQMISFGPFHHGAEHLKKYEEHKSRALAHFLHQADKRAELFVSKLRSILKQLQDTYQDLDKKWKNNPNEFLKMMLLDGCFMIEVLRGNESSYAPNDPVFSWQKKPLCKPNIKQDMLSIENQFPLLVLKALLEVENRVPTDDVYINNLVLSYCSDYLRGSIPRLASHPLMLYRMSRLTGDTNHTIVGIKKTTISMTTKAIENAVKLKDIGVHFRKSQSMSLRDIKFDTKTGWLELPVFPVDDETEHLLLNLIAYEKYVVGNVGNEIMSYIKFLYELIDTEDDVKLLQKNGIISYPLRSKDITDLFTNSLGKSVVVDPSNDSLSTLRSMLSDYIDYKRNIFRRNPWVKSVAVATFVFTFVQTIYSVLTFHLTFHLRK